METIQMEETDPTTLDTLRRSLGRLNEFIDEEEPSTAALLAAKEGDAVGDAPPDFYETRELNLQAELSDELRNIVRSVAEASLKKELIQHELGHSPQDHELAYLRLSEHPDVEAKIEYLSRFDTAQTFDEDEDFAESVDFYVLAPSYRDTTATFFRKPAARRDLAVDSARRTGLRAVLGEANRYQKFDRKVFRFDGRVDFFVWEGIVFVSSNHKLRQILGKFEEVREKVDSHTEELTSKLPKGVEITNVDDFREACKSDGTMASKLARVAQRDYWESVTRENIEGAIEEFRLAEREKIEYSNGKLTWNAAPQQRHTLLKLLGDDYLGSTMTGEKYEAGGNKRRIPDTS